MDTHRNTFKYNGISAFWAGATAPAAVGLALPINNLRRLLPRSVAKAP